MDDLFHEMPGAMVSEQSSAVSKGFMDYVHARKNTHSRSIAERKARSDKWGFYEKADIEGLKNAFTSKKYRQHQNAMMRDEYQKAKKKRVSKGWGADAAARGARTAQKVKLTAKKTKPVSGAAQDHYNRAWRKFTNLQERSNAGEKISPMRSRSFAPLENQLPGYGCRTGSNWEFTGNKRVRKSYEEISKLGPPKASGYMWSPVDATTRQPKERKSKGSYKYQGKSLILRRPKYSFQVLPDLKKGDTYENTVFTRQKYRGGGKEFHAAHTGKKPLTLNGVKYKDVSKAALPTKWNGMMQGIPRATSRMKGSKFQVFGPPGAGRTKMAGPGMNMPAHKPSWAKPLPGPKRTKVDMNKRPPSVWD